MSNKKEYAIGEEVPMGLETLVCVEVGESTCTGCQVFHDINDCEKYVGHCSYANRTDNKDVIFKLKEE